MTNGLHFFHRHYFHRRLQKQLQELYASVAILDFALAAVILFEPIYLWRLGYGVTDLMWYYVVVYGLYFFLAPLGGKIVARFGPERSIATSTLFLVGYYLALLLVPQSAVWFWIAPVLFALQKMLYWPAYHTDFLRSADPKEQGKEYSAMWSLVTIVMVLGPLVGGFVVAWFGFTTLFIGAMVIILLSSIPLFVVPTRPASTPLSYSKMLWLSFHPRYRRQTLGFLALGEELILLTIWPLFLALTYASLDVFGSIVAGSTLLTALLTLVLGNYLDRHQPAVPLRWSGFVTALVWLTRPVLHSLRLVFLSDILGRMAKNGSFVSLSTLIYARARKEQTPIIQSVLLEQGFALGKGLGAILVIIAANFFSPLEASFVIAGALSFFYLLFR